MEIEIEGLARGEGVGTLPSGKRVFVPGAAPGDLVELSLTEDRPRHARGRITRMVREGPDRVAPACRHAGTCGGCQLQHVSTPAQLAARDASFAEVLQRVGGVGPRQVHTWRSILASPTPLRWRTRTRLHVRGRDTGFLRRASHELCAISECPQLVEPLEAVVLRVAALLRERPAQQLGAVDACAGADGSVALALDPGAPGDLPGRLLELPGVKGVIVRVAPPRGLAPGATPPARLLGDVVVERPAPAAPGAALLGRPDVFAQANAAAAGLLVEQVIADLEIAPADEVLELHAGAGTFTLALASRAARVLAVEEVELAGSLSRQAAERAGLGARVRHVTGDATRVARDLAAAGRRFDLALLDPPRAGAREVLEPLSRLGPRRVAYVSCDPGTLARDLAVLRRLGYVPRTVTPVDMFPQTYHVEGAVVLERARALVDRRAVGP